ncbi:hypothetical protein LJC48_02320 [Desulfovibrio sp. OttesenSCG-928-C06]|nr:hypothetical protein [Desulfovibrio sp. OttesenSCG-928-C06]
MLLLAREDIKKFFTLKDSIEAVKQAFSLFSDNKVQVPLRTHINAEKKEGVYLCMPAYCEEVDASCVKVLNMFKNNIAKGIPSINAQVLMLNTDTGVIEGLIDGTYITQLRTGAASGAAFELLAKKDCKKGALIGTGGQAATQLEAMIVARKLDEVQLCDMDFERAKKFAATMSAELAAYGTKITAVENADIAVEDADLIITVTPSTKPVFNADKVKAGATLSCVGSYQPQMQEMDPKILVRATKLYFDSEEAVLSEAGDILIPLADGTITKEKFTGDLGEVINGRLVGRENDEEIIVFKTVGIAAQDLITAKAIFEKAKKAGAGYNWA